ncbi:hypothetical protein DFJ63DRAFT_336670 [Scheffersomyces coipomensis]|uniref:uncharacterized protein n=1 Tax=Scheffersomyces coipomensis TaxID=1788519 RepID=UPI00315CB382
MLESNEASIYYNSSLRFDISTQLKSYLEEKLNKELSDVELSELISNLVLAVFSENKKNRLNFPSNMVNGFWMWKIKSLIRNFSPFDDEQVVDECNLTIEDNGIYSVWNYKHKPINHLNQIEITRKCISELAYFIERFINDDYTNQIIFINHLQEQWVKSSKQEKKQIKSKLVEDFIDFIIMLEKMPNTGLRDIINNAQHNRISVMEMITILQTIIYLIDYQIKI